MAPIQLATRPIYLQLRDALADLIATAEWKPGDAIPNEGELAREYGVSPGTMRKALGLLEADHLITRRQGRGTFVNDPAANGLADRFCNIHGADGKPFPGRIEKAAVTQAAANNTECDRLRVRSGDQVWRVRRVRFDQDRPFMYEEVSLPAELFPGLGEHDCSRIVALAQQHGLLLGAAHERLSVGAATSEAAQAMDIEAESPVIVLDRVVHAFDGRPAEWRLAQCRLAASRYVAHID